MKKSLLLFIIIALTSCKQSNNSENKFTLSNLVGYSYQPNSSNSCSGGNDGKISLVSRFPSINPNYHFNSSTGELTCTFQNSELSYPSCDANSIAKIANAKKKLVWGPFKT